jgi:hypothetical protein
MRLRSAISSLKGPVRVATLLAIRTVSAGLFVTFAIKWASEQGPFLSTITELRHDLWDDHDHQVSFLSLLCVIGVAAATLRSGAIGFAVDEKIPENDESSAIQSAGGIVIRLRRRARRLRSVASLILSLIFTSIVSGLLVFALAGRIAIADEAAAFARSVVQSDFMDYFRERSSSERDFLLHLKRYDAVTEFFRHGIYEASSSGKLDTASASTISDSLNAIATDLQRAAREKPQTRDESEAKFQRVLSAIDDSARRYFVDRTSSWMTATTTRVGAVLLLIFLVQILVPVYRYTLRLSSFYSSRADALSLVGNRTDFNLSETGSLLSPDGIEFGKPPPAMIEQVAKSIVAAQSRIVKQSG